MTVNGGSAKSTPPATRSSGGSGATAELQTPRDDRCPHRCGYRYPIAACVRLHLIQHHNYGYDEAQEAYPDE